MGDKKGDDPGRKAVSDMTCLKWSYKIPLDSLFFPNWISNGY